MIASLTPLREFIKLEASGGIMLIAAAALALILANSPFFGVYNSFLNIPVVVQFGELAIDKPLLLWINDGLMAVFFFLVGLEIKREFLDGELSSASNATLPALAAVGGMAGPALIYYLINQDTPEMLNGWAIPTATDIAFALGVLALLGSRVPTALKVLLTAIAIIDDLGAIVIIALFYTADLSVMSLALGGLFIVGLIVANRMGVARPAVYILLGLGLWVCVLKSGVHATLAGVITALAIPMQREEGGAPSMLHAMEHRLHPWVAFMVLPLFAFANAGVSFSGIGMEGFTDPVMLGISTGLFFGKQIGVFLLLFLTIRFGLASMPTGTNWQQLYAVSLLCGIGFTMSLFIGSLAFTQGGMEVPIRLGVLSGSILSAVLGYILLKRSLPAQA